MKILFVNPNLRPGNPTGKFLPVGLAYVMTAFKHENIDYELLDICIHDHDDDYVDRFFQENPFDVVLIGSIVTHYKWMKWFVKMVKRHQPKCKIVVGNSVSGSIPKVWMENTPTDYIVTGEGEYAALDVIRHLQNNTPPEDLLGVTFRRHDGEIIQNPKRKAVSIQQVPMIDWSDFDVEKYFAVQKGNSAKGIELSDGEELRVMPVSTARGCVFKCTFCHYVFWDDPYRHRSAEDILKECKRNIDVYGANYINFWDDLSFTSIRQSEKIANAILKSGLKFYWSAAIRADLFGNPKIPEEKRIRVAKKFRESGCVSVGFSLESGNEDILKMMKKKIKAEYFGESIRIVREAGINCNTSVVFGYPIETPQTIQETFQQCADNNVYPSIGILLPLPYTEMYEYAKKHGFITDENAYLDSITERQDICLNMTQMSDSELLGLIKSGAEELNETLKLGLNAKKLIRTGGYREHTKLKKVDSHKKMVRNKNDFSFNYTDATFNEEVPGQQP